MEVFCLKLLKIAKMLKLSNKEIIMIYKLKQFRQRLDN